MGIPSRNLPPHIRARLNLQKQVGAQVQPGKRKRTLDVIAQGQKIGVWESSMCELPGAFIPTRCDSPNAQRRNHWRVLRAHARVQRRSAAIYARLLGIKAPCAVRLTRYGPGKLDGDNLQGSLKAIRDGVQDAAGVPDSDPRWTWIYAQERAPGYGARIEVVNARTNS